MEKNTQQHPVNSDSNISSTTDYNQHNPTASPLEGTQGISYGVEVREYEAHSGPLPSPDVLKAYDDIVPGAAERIIRMAEKQLDHNIGYDQATLKCVNNSEKRGQWFGFILTIILIGAGVWATLEGQIAVACVIFGTAIAAVAGAFVSNMLRMKKNKE